jgi:hypothetical protein
MIFAAIFSYFIDKYFKHKRVTIFQLKPNISIDTVWGRIHLKIFNFTIITKKLY